MFGPRAELVKRLTSYKSKFYEGESSTRPASYRFGTLPSLRRSR